MNVAATAEVDGSETYPRGGTAATKLPPVTVALVVWRNASVSSSTTPADIVNDVVFISCETVREPPLIVKSSMREYATSRFTPVDTTNESATMSEPDPDRSSVAGATGAKCDRSTSKSDRLVFITTFPVNDRTPVPGKTVVSSANDANTFPRPNVRREASDGSHVPANVTSCPTYRDRTSFGTVVPEVVAHLSVAQPSADAREGDATGSPFESTPIQYRSASIVSNAPNVPSMRGFPSRSYRLPHACPDASGLDDRT